MELPFHAFKMEVSDSRKCQGNLSVVTSLALVLAYDSELKKCQVFMGAGSGD